MEALVIGFLQILDAGPLFMTISGYLLINALPAVIIDNFSIGHWIELTLRPVGEIAEYEQSLKEIVGDGYEVASATAKVAVRLLGLIQVIWIAMWGFAFARAIKR